MTRLPSPTSPYPAAPIKRKKRAKLPRSGTIYDQNLVDWLDTRHAGYQAAQPAALPAPRAELPRPAGIPRPIGTKRPIDIARSLLPNPLDIKHGPAGYSQLPMAPVGQPRPTAWAEGQSALGGGTGEAQRAAQRNAQLRKGILGLAKTRKRAALPRVFMPGKVRQQMEDDELALIQERREADARAMAAPDDPFTGMGLSGMPTPYGSLAEATGIDPKLIDMHLKKRAIATYTDQRKGAREAMLRGDMTLADALDPGAYVGGTDRPGKSTYEMFKEDQPEAWEDMQERTGKRSEGRTLPMPLRGELLRARRGISPAAATGTQRLVDIRAGRALTPQGEVQQHTERLAQMAAASGALGSLGDITAGGGPPPDSRVIGSLLDTIAGRGGAEEVGQPVAPGTASPYTEVSLYLARSPVLQDQFDTIMADEAGVNEQQLMSIMAQADVPDEVADRFLKAVLGDKRGVGMEFHGKDYWDKRKMLADPLIPRDHPVRQKLPNSYSDTYIGF